jgi:hypothetical protein
MAQTDPDELYEQQCEERQDWLSGWAASHDYDPTWDYTVCFEHRQHPLYLLACEVMARVCADSAADSRIPFDNGRIFPAQLDGVAALYIAGTSSEPVVLIDVATHAELDERDRTRALSDSVVHELRHAVQEAYDLPFCEDEAEHGSAQLPF